jgi:hypothetical protein
MDIQIRVSHISVLSVTNRDYGTGPGIRLRALPASGDLQPGWLLAERTGRNDIPDNGLCASRNLIAFFS